MNILLAARRALGLVALAGLCSPLWGHVAMAVEEPSHPVALDNAIVAAAKRHGVPEHLVRRVIMRESKYNPRARNRRFWGLMQISYPTAKSMGFKGTAQELLNPVVNLRYAVPYLANAFVIAGKREDAAVRLYAAGYYNTAKSRGLLSFLRTANSVPLAATPEERPMLAANAVVQPPQSIGIFGALFGPGSQPQPEPQPSTQVAVADGAAAAPSAPPARATAADAPAGTFNGPTASMVAGKDGALAPPKKWSRDGGTTVIARGEQGLESIPSRVKSDIVSKRSSKRAKKLTAFAALDVPLTSAQAYAGAPGQDPRFAAAASQAAIAQATAGQTTPAGAPLATPQDEATSRAASLQLRAGPAVEDASDADSVEEKPKKRRKSHHARKHKSDNHPTREAKAEKTAPEPSKGPPPTTTQ